ncbi:hypothetical protein [Flavobacterium psychraquaticum]|uniref:hypothetical protein n=1 Tax=Flavobacterium psychraquaticum TaxID=3103958 RepID=UPI002ACE4096|nr:hypothetical protein [Flavobacterium sp. LB-N7T]
MAFLSVSVSIVAAPYALPAVVVAVVGYAAVGSAILSAVRQITVEDFDLKQTATDEKCKASSTKSVGRSG